MEIFRLAGMPVAVRAITTADYAAAAPRPSYSVLDTTAYHRLGGPPMPDWRSALVEYFAKWRRYDGRSTLQRTFNPEIFGETHCPGRRLAVEHVRYARGWRLGGGGADKSCPDYRQRETADWELRRRGDLAGARVSDCAALSPLGRRSERDGAGN